MSLRRVALAVGLVLIAGSLGAYLYYFAWSAPRLDPERIEAFAFGTTDYQIRDLVRHDRTEEADTLDRLISQVNEADLASDAPSTQGTGFMVILLREDGLQYKLLPTDSGQPGQRGLVGISEGSGDFKGYLVSPELAREIAALEKRSDSLR